MIGRYFLEAITKRQIISTVLRKDFGTENSNLRDFQQALRYNHYDDQAGENSFIFVKSTANQRIERFWSHFRRHTLDFFIALFKNMEDLNLLNVKNPIHIEVLRYCFGPIIEHYIKLSKKEWNDHRIRKQNFRNIAGGIPNVLYYCPEFHNGVQCGKAVNLDHVKILLKEYTSEPYLVDPEVKTILDDLFGHEAPHTSEQALYLYFKIIDFLNM